MKPCKKNQHKKDLTMEKKLDKELEQRNKTLPRTQIISCGPAEQVF